MPTPTKWQAYTWEDVGVYLFDLIKGNNGSNITQASITAITAKVFDINGTQVGATITIDKTTSVFDTIKTKTDDPRYSGKNGFNFRVLIAGTYVPEEGTYRIEIYFTDTTAPGNVFPDVWEVEAQGILGT